MMSVREKKRHRQGCGPFAYDLPTENLDEKGQQRERRTLASYRRSSKYPWAADECDTFSVTDGYRIEIRDRGLGSCDSE
jgi:hypothetical protein